MRGPEDKKVNAVSRGQKQGKHRDARLSATSSASTGEPGVDGELRGRSAIKPRRISSTDWSFFFDSLGTMLNAGLGLSESFDLLSKGNQNPYLASIASSISRSLLKGKSLYLACSAPEFRPLHLAMLRIGEETGTLTKVFFSLAQFEKGQARIQLALRSAMTYPLALIALVTVLVAILPAFFQKPMSHFLASLGTEVPFVWEIVFQFSSFLCNGWVLVGGVILYFVYWNVFTKPFSSGPLHKWLWKTVFKIPILRKVAQPVCEQRLASTLAYTLDAGTTPVESLSLVGDAMGNPVFKQACLDIADAIAGGTELPSAFEDAGLFSRTLLAFIEVGEETGQLPSQLNCYSDMVSLTIEEDLKAAFSLLQPFFLIFLAFVILALAVSVVGPLSQAVQAL